MIRAALARALGVAILVACLMVGVATAFGSAQPTREAKSGVWLSAEELAALPTSGPAWEALRRAAQSPTNRPDLSDQDDATNVRVLAKALVAARTGDEDLRREVVRALERARGTERGASVLAVARELIAYVVAADLIGLDGPDRAAFVAWLEDVRDREFHHRTLRSTHEDRPNNWGTHAGASRLAVAIYLGDQDEIARAAWVFRGWVGETRGWHGFEFGRLWWQSSYLWRYGINPAGATYRGHSIDGVLPDDQRRGGPFTWPPPKENYVYEALQGAVVQAALLSRAGYDAWEWGDRAILRAFRWLHDEASFPAVGDDTWLPHIVNRIYGTSFPAPSPSRPGKGIGFSDWTHANPVEPPVAAPVAAKESLSPSGD
ncbi:MAG: alginate lyase family protein [bacterium]|nr:alginate lyase family protein [bacterium]